MLLVKPVNAMSFGRSNISILTLHKPEDTITCTDLGNHSNYMYLPKQNACHVPQDSMSFLPRYSTLHLHQATIALIPQDLQQSYCIKIQPARL